MQAFDIIELLRMIGVMNAQDRGKEVVSSCPFAPWAHDGGVDRNPSFHVTVSNEKSICHCFGCNFSSTIRQLIWEFAKYEDGIYYELKGFVDEHESIGIESTVSGVGTYEERYGGRKNLPHHRWLKEEVQERKQVNHVVIDKLYEKVKGHVPKYILGRGVSIEVCKRFELGYDNRFKDQHAVLRCLKCGVRELRYRSVVFFIRNTEGKRVAWIRRDIDSDEGILLDKPEFFCYKCQEEMAVEYPQKYLYNFGFVRNEILYGEYESLNRIAETGLGEGLRSEKLFIVEGAIDVLRLATLGLNAVATLGSSISDNQCGKIREIVKKADFEILVAMTDADKPGEKIGYEIVRRFAGEIPICRVSFEKDKDPADLKSAEEVRKLIERAERY